MNYYSEIFEIGKKIVAIVTIKNIDLTNNYIYNINEARADHPNRGNLLAACFI